MLLKKHSNNILLYSLINFLIFSAICAMDSSCQKSLEALENEIEEIFSKKTSEVIQLIYFSTVPKTVDQDAAAGPTTTDKKLIHSQKIKDLKTAESKLKHLNKELDQFLNKSIEIAKALLTIDAENANDAKTICRIMHTMPSKYSSLYTFTKECHDRMYLLTHKKPHPAYKLLFPINPPMP